MGVLVLNLAVIGLLMYALHAVRQQKEAEVRQSLENVAELLAQNLDNTMHQVDLGLRDVVALLEQQLRHGTELSPSEVNQVLDDRQHWMSNFAEFRIGDAEGLIHYGPGVDPTHLTSMAARPFFAQHREHADAGLIVSNPVIGQIRTEWIVLFSRRYNDRYGHFAGVVTASLPLRQFQKTLDRINVGPHGAVVLRDTEMGLMARNPLPEGAAGQVGAKIYSRELGEMAASKQRVGFYHTVVGLGGDERTLAYRRLDLVPFHLAVGAGTEDYLAVLHGYERNAVDFEILFFLVTAMAAWFLWRLFNDTERARQRSQLLLRNAHDGIHIIDRNGLLVEANDSFVRMLDQDRSIIGRLHIPDWDAAGREDHAARLTSAGQHVTFETRHRRRDGSLLDVEVKASAIDIDGEMFVYAASRDISERKKAETELRIAAAAFESQEGIVVTDAHNIILRVNHAFTQITGFTPEDAVGRSTRMLNSDRHDPAFYLQVRAAVRDKGQWHGEMWICHKNQSASPDWVTITAVRGSDGNISHYVCTLIDISERKVAEEEIRTLAFYDSLTNLPNRRLLGERLQQAITASARDAGAGALLFIDMDNFKTLNDTHGHNLGDLLLTRVAQRLCQTTRACDTVARFGGDEFVVMLTDLGHVAGEAALRARAVGEKILQALNQPFDLDGFAYHCSTSIGAALFSGQGQSADELLKRADMAMYQAKSAGRNRLRFFDPRMQAEVTSRVQIETDLRRGLAQQEFLLHFQPQIDATGRVLGAESLVRWLRPETGLVPPGLFIPQAEANGLIVPIGRQVLGLACRQLAAWAHDSLTRDLHLAVNVSAHQFHHADFVSDVMAALNNSGADPRKLELELTESLLLANVDDTVAKMAVLREAGVRFALDDFGTGYSSLSYLKRLPLDQLKIDQSFVRDILTDSNDAAITLTIVNLARSLGLDVIAEGVETEAQRALLLRQNCQKFQGYLFSKPLPAKDFMLYLLEHSAGVEAVSAGASR